MRVAVIAGGSESVAAATVTALEQNGWHAVQASVAVGGSEAEAVRAAVEPFGRLDMLVVGRSKPMMGAIDLQDPDDWWQSVDEGLGRPFRFARAAAPLLRDTSGSIVFMGSEWDGRGLAGGSAASSSAAGLVGLMRALARELAPIRVNVVAPDEVDTDDLTARAAATGRSVEDVQRDLIEISLMGRLGSAAETAAAVLYLAGSRLITGQVLTPIGGRRRG